MGKWTWGLCGVLLALSFGAPVQASCAPPLVTVGRIVVLIGPPGAGKGTQAVNLAKRTGLLQVSTGDLLRAEIAAGTELGKLAEPIMKRGHLVPASLVNAIVAQRIAQPDARGGVLLDGYPRSLEQLRDFEMRGRKIDAVVYLDIGEDEAVLRLDGRRVCPECKATYHVSFKPPSVPGICDSCPTPLVRRLDDEEATIRARFGSFREDTGPLLEEFRRRGILHTFSPEARPELLTEKILRVL